MSEMAWVHMTRDLVENARAKRNPLPSLIMTRDSNQRCGLHVIPRLFFRV